jgi:hypothetical protein
MRAAAAFLRNRPLGILAAGYAVPAEPLPALLYVGCHDAHFGD